MYRPTPHGPEGIAQLGHRNYVGGLWDEIGQLQFDFLVSRGMKPSSCLLDIACGSLRLGVKAIPYLEPRHYLGIDKEAELVRAGLEVELSPAIRQEKQPQLLVSSDFEFEKFESRPDFAIAQSLFTHLPPRRIELCFSKLFPALKEEGVFFATYFEAEERRVNPEEPHDHGYFAYTRDEMISFGTRAGFRGNYIGAWSHPRDQVIVEYRK